MLAVLEQPRIAFFGVPKCMTTALMRFFYRFETGTDYSPADHGGVFVHRYYADRARRAGFRHAEPAALTGMGFWRFTVVREPATRLVSAYGNRVVRHGVLKRLGTTGADGLQGLDPMPTLDTFLRDLDRYRAASADIRHHTEPLSAFIGHDPGALDAVYRMEDTAPLLDALSARLGLAVALERVQTSAGRYSLDDVSDAARRKALDHVRPDYALLEAWYPMPRETAAAAARAGQA